MISVFLLIEIACIAFSINKAKVLEKSVGGVLALCVFLPSPVVLASLRDSEETTRKNILFWFVSILSGIAFVSLFDSDFEKYIYIPLVFAGIFLGLQFCRGDNRVAQFCRIICTAAYAANIFYMIYIEYSPYYYNDNERLMVTSYFMIQAVAAAILNFIVTAPYWSSEKHCPFCGEKIKKEATLCRFCGKELPVAQREQ